MDDPKTQPLRIERGGPASRSAAFIPVTLTLFAGLGRHLSRSGSESLTLEVEKGLTVGEALCALGVPLEEVKVVFVNHRKVEPGHVLEAGDRVGAFPPVAGG